MELDINWEENSVSDSEQEEITGFLKKGIREALIIAGASDDAEIGLVLVDDETIRLLNNNYRGIDRATDVLSFALQEKSEEEPDILIGDEEEYEDFAYESEEINSEKEYSFEKIVEDELQLTEEDDEATEIIDELDFYDDTCLGDIVISVDRARVQAEEFGHSLAREITYLAVHGTMHLLGFDHGTDEDFSEMRKYEELVMTKLSLGR